MLLFLDRVATHPGATLTCKLDRFTRAIPIGDDTLGESIIALRYLVTGSFLLLNTSFSETGDSLLSAVVFEGGEVNTVLRILSRQRRTRASAL